MKNLTFNFVASCKVFNNGEPDKNGKDPILLEPIGGTSPRGLNIISGSSAELTGFQAGKAYAVKATEREAYTREDGSTVRSFNFSPIGEVSAIEAMTFGSIQPLKVVIASESTEVVEENDVAVNV